MRTVAHGFLPSSSPDRLNPLPYPKWTTDGTLPCLHQPQQHTHGFRPFRFFSLLRITQGDNIIVFTCLQYFNWPFWRRDYPSVVDSFFWAVSNATQAQAPCIPNSSDYSTGMEVLGISGKNLKSPSRVSVKEVAILHLFPSQFQKARSGACLKCEVVAVSGQHLIKATTLLHEKRTS